MTDWTGNPGKHRDPYGDGWWHRHWLLDSGQYVKTSQSTRARLIQLLSRTIPSPDPGDEFAALTCHCGRIACRHHQGNNHQRGAAVWMPSEPGSRHWPGCGCP